MKFAQKHVQPLVSQLGWTFFKSRPEHVNFAGAHGCIITLLKTLLYAGVKAADAMLHFCLGNIMFKVHQQAVFLFSIRCQRKRFALHSNLRPRFGGHYADHAQATSWVIGK